MQTISIEIKNLKNIINAEIEMPLERGLNLIVGGNGSGKSTILQALSQSFLSSSLNDLNEDDYNQDSRIKISIGNETRSWTPLKDGGWESSPRKRLSVNGMYEGSLFYGSRFNDSRLIDELIKNGKLREGEIVNADEYVKDKLSYILTGTLGKYPNLKRVRNRDIAKALRLNNTPYFNEAGGKLISQYRMSSGECLLITLLHFVYNAIVRRSLPKNQFILVLIDEVELALHPIAVHRLIETINDLISVHENLLVILTSHSPEVIRKIDPKKIFKIENFSGTVDVVNPAYPSYVIRDVYKHDGFDTLILTEDILAKILTHKVINAEGLADSKLLHIVPAGGWENVLTLHGELLKGNVLGLDRKILSVIDGDVANKVPSNYGHIPKLFLPVDSIEKFLLDVCTNPNKAHLKKIIGDKYFTIKSLSELTAGHVAEHGSGAKNESKKLYGRLLRDLKERSVSEEVFIEKLADDLLVNVDFSKFRENLRKKLT